MNKMNMQSIFIIILSVLFLSYYLIEYTHLTHTSRLLSRKFRTTEKRLNSLTTRKIVGSDSLQALDPFFIFNHYSLAKGEGLLDHAHRGYDTVTYILSGSLEYEDFRNNSGVLNPGDVQWLTSGKGVVHAEVAKTNCEFLQVWIGLPMKYKLTTPAYQTISRDDIISQESDGVYVKVIAGESLGRVSYTITRTPSYFIDATMEGGRVWRTDVPAGWNCLLYVLKGEVEIHGDKLKEFDVGMLSQWDTDLELGCEGGCRVVLVAAEPLDEMIVAFGQFFMPNYPMAEKANRDLKNSADGFEGASQWKSRFVK